ncbi:hypothetical protein HQ529_00100 [Candidatus Woesearchaeota archaeon]|nr:hypothetical protein [Candidatus Woesearchaeota archaeon]
MIETVKKDILKVLIRALDILKEREEKDLIELKELSDHTIHNASIFQDKDSSSMAILIYSLSKIIERTGFIDTKIEAMLISAMNSLKKDDFSGYKNKIKEIFKQLSSADIKLEMYIQEVVEQAQIKKGTKLYEHGISMAQAADVLGVSQWELMSYTGKTKLIDTEQKRTDVKERLRFAKNLFGIQ